MNRNITRYLLDLGQIWQKGRNWFSDQHVIFRTSDFDKKKLTHPFLSIRQIKIERVSSNTNFSIFSYYAVVANRNTCLERPFNYGPLSLLYCFIQQCVYIRFACRSKCGHSNPVLRAETFVLHCQDDSTPLINRTFRRHQG